MRPDLIRLVVDTDRKSLVSEASHSGAYTVSSTMERVGLNKPLSGEDTA
jgi:cyanide hydratase